MGSHLEEALTLHTSTASPIRGGDGRGRERGEGEREREREGLGSDVFHKCSSIKCTDPKGVQ